MGIFNKASMAQQFYNRNKKVKQLEPSYYEQYDKVLQFLLKQSYDTIDTKIYLDQVVEQLMHAQQNHIAPQQVTGKKFSEYIRQLEKKIHKQQLRKAMMQEDYEQYVFSGIWYTICAFLVLLFIKALCLDRFFIHYHIDLLIAAAAFYLGANNFYQHVKIVQRWGLHNHSLLLEIAGFILSLCVMVLLLRSPFDASLFIMAITYFLSRRLIKKEMEQHLTEIKG